MGTAKLSAGKASKTREAKEAKVPMAKEKKEPKPKLEDKKRECPECGIPNQSTRMTCEVCGHAMYQDAKTELFESNKRLKAAISIGDVGLVKTLKNKIRGIVDLTGGLYKTDEDGFAIQIKATGESKKVAKREKVEKEAGKCPCCGADTNPGSAFIPGHDGRIKGWFKRMDKGEEIETTERVVEMYNLWVASDRTKTVKELAKETK